MIDPITPLTPEQVRKESAQAAAEGYLHRSVVSLDQFVNVLAGGKPDETISSRAARAADKGKLWGRSLSRLLNLFQHDHGADAEAGDLERAQAIERIEKSTNDLL